MAVGWCREFLQHLAPPVAIGRSVHGQLERGFAAGFAPYRRPAKQPPAQRVQLAFLQLPQAALQQHAQVVGGDGQMMQRLRAPEAVHAQPFDSELSARPL